MKIRFDRNDMLLRFRPADSDTGSRVFEMAFREEKFLLHCGGGCSWNLKKDALDLGSERRNEKSHEGVVLLASRFHLLMNLKDK